MQNASESGFAQPLENQDVLDGTPASSGAGLTGRLGAAPWWGISGAFHGLLLLMLALLSMAIMRVDHKDQVIVVPLVKNPPPKDEPQAKPALKPVKYEVPLETQELEKPVLLHDSDEVKEIEVYDQLNLDNHDPKGSEGISDMNTGNVGNIGVLGVGGGGSNPFGRPDGIGSMYRKARKSGGPETVPHVELALKWLADHQEVDGHWDCVKYGGKQADVAVTGLALLAFLGAGHTEKVGKYADNVKRGVYWLMSIQGDDGKYYKQGETHGIGYHHAIAGLAMVEAAGMGRVPDTIKSAQRGVDYSAEKHQQGENSDKLAWRYGPREAGDLSVTGWFIMQLKSAKIAKLQVPQSSFEGAVKFLDHVEQKGQAGEAYGGHRYGYTNNQSIGHRRTAIGCLSRQFLGWNRDELKGGVEWFMEKGGLPQWDGNGNNVDLYYWYYGTLCVFQQDAPKGELWNKWNTAMKKALCENQRKGGDENGSWDPVGAYSEYWGRAGQTALAALCLEVYYRYNLMTK